MPKNTEPNLKELFDLAIDELEISTRRGNALTYIPYSDQLGYHQSQCLGRYASGGNRAGKTDAQVLDAYWYATNTHPYRKREELHPTWGSGPVQLRFVVVDVAKGLEQILLPKMKRWIPRSACINGSFDDSWDKNNYIFTFANGSTIDVLTYGMTIEKHGGVPRHGIYFDEEPPREIFNENMARLRDYRGFWSIAATPVNGITWTFDLLWEPAENYWNRIKAGDTRPVDYDQDEIDFISTHTLDPANNPYLDADEEYVKHLFVAMDAEERQIREHGQFVAKGGLIFPNFKKETHVLVEPLPLSEYINWKWYSSVDVGWSNPTAWLWHAVAPDGRIYTFAEHYKSHMTVPEHAKVVLEREAEWHRTPDIRTGDPAMKQTSGITGTSYLIEYGRCGIGIGVEGIPHDVMIGIEKMQQYIQVHERSPWGENRPMWMISPNCPNLIRELRRLRRATYDSSKQQYDKNVKEEIHKKDDHAADSSRYFFTMMPNLTPEMVKANDVEIRRGSYLDIMAEIVRGRNESLSSTATTKWDTVDDYDYEEEYA